MAGDEADDHRLNVDPALVRLLTLYRDGHYDQTGIQQALRLYAQERYERWMRRCQHGWEATRDPAFVVEAQVMIDFEQQPPPPWLSEAIYDLLMERRSKEHVTDAHNALVRRRRYEAVCAAKSAGMTWEAAYAQAAETLAETPARGSADSMKKAYVAVAKDIKEGRSDKYITPRSERGEILKRRGEILRRNPASGDSEA